MWAGTCVFRRIGELFVPSYKQTAGIGIHASVLIVVFLGG
jgi:hypothetical protein